MTTDTRILITPRLESAAYASTTTARAHHAATLAELVDDASGGHPGQRWRVNRNGSGTFHGFYRHTTNGAKHLVVRATVGVKGSPVAGNGASLTLSVTDGTNTVSATPTIPAGLDGTPVWEPLRVTSRTISFATFEWVLSLDALDATLTANDDWRFVLVTVVDAAAYLELFEVEELPRWVVDTADGYGQIPTDYLPRGVIRDGAGGLQRIGTTLRAAYLESLRTYHAMSRPEASLWQCTSGSYGGLSNDVESGTTAIRYVVRPRRMRGSTRTRVRWRLRYRIVGASDPAHTGKVRLYTGHGSSPFELTLADTAGVWTDTAVQTAYLKTDGTNYLDTLYFEAKRDSGTLDQLLLVLYH